MSSFVPPGAMSLEDYMRWLQQTQGENAGLIGGASPVGSGGGVGSLGAMVPQPQPPAIEGDYAISRVPGQAGWHGTGGPQDSAAQLAQDADLKRTRDERYKAEMASIEEAAKARDPRRLAIEARGLDLEYERLQPEGGDTPSLTINNTPSDPTKSATAYYPEAQGGITRGEQAAGDIRRTDAIAQRGPATPVADPPRRADGLAAIATAQKDIDVLYGQLAAEPTSGGQANIQAKIVARQTRLRYELAVLGFKVDEPKI